jgi:citrate lyase subunit beta/citryl-CoA lyase
VNRVFAPTEDELAWARRVVEAFEQSERDRQGVLGFEGTMVDLPVVARAQRLLQEAKGAPR